MVEVCANYSIIVASCSLNAIPPPHVFFSVTTRWMGYVGLGLCNNGAYVSCCWLSSKTLE